MSASKLSHFSATNHVNMISQHTEDSMVGSSNLRNPDLKSILH